MTRVEALRRLEELKRRTQSVDTIALCDIMAGLLANVVAEKQRVEKQRFDRNAYQREYMKRWREKRRGV